MGGRGQGSGGGQVGGRGQGGGRSGAGGRGGGRQGGQGGAGGAGGCRWGAGGGQPPPPLPWLLPWLLLLHLIDFCAAPGACVGRATPTVA